MTTEVSSDAAALVQQGEAVMRIENETLLQVAIQRPRDEAKLLKGALEELELVPEEAGSAYYSIPFKDDGGATQLVEGPSIKAAMALGRRWGNCSIGGRILSEDATGFNVEGVFIDYESSVRVLRPYRVSRFIKRRNGGTMELNAQRLPMAIQAGTSKAMRNAVLAGLPAYLVNSYFKKAKGIVAATITAAKVLKGFEKWNVTIKQLEDLVELPQAAWDSDTLATLRGVWTAINDGQSTVEETFPTVAPPAEPTGNGTKKSGMDTLTERLRAQRGPTAPPAPVQDEATVTKAPEIIDVPAEGGEPAPGAETPQEPSAGPTEAPDAPPAPGTEQEVSMLRSECSGISFKRGLKPQMWQYMVKTHTGVGELSLCSDPAALRKLKAALEGLPAARGGSRGRP